jgi:hypothetical protein
MILDKESMFSDDQAITATAASTNIIDLGATGTVVGSSSALKRYLGQGEPIEILVQWTATAVSGGSSTVTVDLETDDNSGFSSAATLATTGAIVKATLVQGHRMSIKFMPEKTERYLRLNFTVATANLTAGTVTAGLVMGTQTNVNNA